VPLLRCGRGWRDLLRPSSAWVPLYFLALYLFLNAIWAANQLFALGSAALFTAVILIVCASSRAVPQIPPILLRRAAFAFAAGTFLGTIYLLLELVTHMSIMRWALNSIDLLQRNAKHMQIVQGQVTKIKPSVLDRNVAIITFNLWSALLVLTKIETRHRLILAVMFFTLTAAAIFTSEHDSSQVALLLSPLIFFSALFWPRLTVQGLATTWCLAFVLVLPAVLAAYKAELHTASWLPTSARHRVIIWEYTAERVPDHLWGGIGAASTPTLKPKRDIQEKPSGFRFARSTGEHAHDLFLQAWYELGVAGVFLIAFAGAAVALAIYSLPIQAVAFVAATFFVCVAIEAFAWSIWQTWLMCAVGLLAIYVRVASYAFKKLEEK
jgi:O-Antigen ligase